MGSMLIKTIVGGFLLIAAAVPLPTALAQQAAVPAQPTLAPPAPGSLAIPAPNYVSIVQEIAVDRPAKAVWARIGKFCDVGEWFGTACVITSGKDGELGAVRQLGGSALEVLVGKTDLSYTYTQPVRIGQPYPLYHGTMEAKPVTSTTSKIVYSLFFDNSMLPDADARERDRARRATRFMDGLKNMKVLAEGGALPSKGAASPAPTTR